jgi:hypothetical protein
MRNSASDLKRLMLQVIPIYLTSLIISFQLDKSVIRSREIFPWDSRVYFELSRKLFNSEELPINVDYPWGARILFPFLSGLVHKILKLSEINSSLLLNELAVLLVCLFSAWLWRRIGIRQPFILFGISAICLSSVGPLRTTMYYPGNGYAFECAITALTFISICFMHGRGLITAFVFSGLLFLLTLGREFSAYIVVLFSIYTVTRRIITRYRGNKTDIESSESIRTPFLFMASIASFTGLMVTNYVTNDSRGDFPFVRAAFTNGWDHLHLFNAVYPYFFSLGPIAVILTLKLTLSIKNLKAVRSNLSNMINFFAVTGVFFSMFVGGDTDRFIWWFFPFLSAISLLFFQEIIERGYLSKSNLITLLLVSILWSRVFLPAIPPIQFVGEKLQAFASIRTDYDVDKYVGPGVLRNFINEGKVFTFNDPIALDIESSRLTNIEIFLPIGTIEEEIMDGQTEQMYSFDINKYPVPFGFLHNNYEMFILHPQHGERKAKIIYLAQWLGLHLYLSISVARRNRIGIRKWK